MQQDKKNNVTYKTIIEEQGFFICTPVGTSMNPMLYEREDTVKLIKADNIKKYDVILYQRKNGLFVLHRVVGKDDKGYILCGDNQFIKEHGITDDMIIGKMDGFYKGEKYIPCDDKKYIKYYKRRVRSIPFRYFIFKVKRIIKKIIGRK